VHDRGVGIPATIRVRFADKFLLITPSDEELIVKAVVSGEYSRTKIPTRGKGLPTLKMFVDESDSGELTIVSGKSLCQFGPRKRVGARQMKHALEGTLIVWALKRS